MDINEFTYTVLLLLTLGDMLLPQAQLALVICALLLVSIRRENSK